MIPAVLLTSVDEDVATRTLVGEASDQSLEGQVSVAWVMRNRALWQPRAFWGSTITAVCQYPKQFSCWNGGENTDRIKSMPTADQQYQKALVVIRSVMAGQIPDPTCGATTYKVRGTPAMWDTAVQDMPPKSIGAHDFWRLDPRGPCLAFLTPDVGGSDDGATATV